MKFTLQQNSISQEITSITMGSHVDKKTSSGSFSLSLEFLKDSRINNENTQEILRIAKILERAKQDIMWSH